METIDFKRGNYIYHDWIDSNGDYHDTIRVWGVTQKYLVVNSNMLPEYESIMANAIKPIPITEEWLLKFGFEKGKYSDKMSVTYDKNPISLNFAYWKPELNWSLNISCIHLNHKSYKYIHEIQNLYNSLTNKELTIKQK